MMTTTKVRRRAMAVLAAGTIGLGALAMVSPASAGEPAPDWPGEVITVAECVDGQGVILVDIFDDFGADYDVFLFLGEDLVDEVLGVSDTDEIGDTGEGENTIEFPVTDGVVLVDGTYTVEIDWLYDEELELYDTVFVGDVTVDCVPDDTTTTAAPSSTTAAPAAAAAAAATPRFTG